MNLAEVSVLELALIGAGLLWVLATLAYATLIRPKRNRHLDEPRDVSDPDSVPPNPHDVLVSYVPPKALNGETELLAAPNRHRVYSNSSTKSGTFETLQQEVLSELRLLGCPLQESNGVFRYRHPDGTLAVCVEPAAGSVTDEDGRRFPGLPKDAVVLEMWIETAD